MPPENLMQPAQPLAKKPVPTTRQLVDRLLVTERAYEELAVRHDALLEWLRATKTQ